MTEKTAKILLWASVLVVMTVSIYCQFWVGVAFGLGGVRALTMEQN